MAKKPKIVSVRLSPEAKLLLDELAKETGRTVSELIRQLLRNSYEGRIGEIEIAETNESEV